jgi:hypothetical protein
MTPRPSEGVLALMASAWRRGQAGWPTGYVIVQIPNAPLLIALAGSVVAGVTEGRAEVLAQATGRLALGVFAYLEITQGANRVRRALGAAVAVWLVFEVGRDLR